jgi:hypothetical protein
MRPAANAGENPAASVLNELVSALRFVAAKQGTLLSPKAEHEGSADQRKAAGLAIGRFRALTEDLQSMDRSLTHPVYRDFAVDQSAALRALGIQGLIEANDPDGIRSAAANWDELAASGDVNPIIGSLMGFSNGSDGGAVRALGSLATRENAEPGLQQSASYALRSIHTREAVAALVALLGVKGEKDENAERVRINALSGLCLFVRNAPTVTPQAVVSMSWTCRMRNRHRSSKPVCVGSNRSPPTSSRWTVSLGASSACSCIKSRFTILRPSWRR